jgi:hypothetical protein
VAIASQIGEAAAPLISAANEAFIEGMQTAVWVAVGVALFGAVITWIFLPARPLDSVPAVSEQGGEEPVAAS